MCWPGFRVRSTTPRPRHLLPVVVLAQFAGTSVWFATNAVIPDLERELGLSGTTSWLTGAVQLGFIAGTAMMSLTGLADRFSPRWVFLAGCVLAGLCNLSTLAASGLVGLVLARFACGAALAAVYPIGMKVAAGWVREGLGSALGWLVGALVLGTAFPHLLRGLAVGLPWASIVALTSVLSVGGGVLLAALVPDGPYLRPSAGFDLSAVPRLWAIPEYRAAALGYFGHMWELYTLWAVLPALAAAYLPMNPSLLSFSVIAVGAIGCGVGGMLSSRIGSAGVARVLLGISGLCCAAAPLLWTTAPVWLLVGFLLIWGVAVVGDSPQFSALSAQAAPPELIGTGLALATAVGFGLTVISLQVAALVPLQWVAWALLPGPLLGLWAMRRLH